MSDGKTPGKNPFEIVGIRSLVNFFPAQVKDTVILAGWIVGLILIAALSWSLIQPLRTRFLLRAVNRVLEQSGDFRRLRAPVSPGELRAGFSNGRIPAAGFWYTMTELPVRQARDSDRQQLPEGTKAFVFAFIGEGTFFPCAAVVTPEGKVEEFIALNSRGEKVMQRISPGILRIYTRRIEGAKS